MDLRLRNFGAQKIFRTQWMLFAGRAVHTSRLLEKHGGIQVEDTVIEGLTLLPTPCMGCCDVDLQESILLMQAREGPLTKKGSANQGLPGGTGVFRCGLVV